MVRRDLGKLFEAQVLASLPTQSISGREVYRHKLSDQPARQAEPCRVCRRGLIEKRCKTCKAKSFGATFTPKHPVDLYVSCPWKGTEKMKSRCVPQAHFGFELKARQGKIARRGPSAGQLHATLSIKTDGVKRHQVYGLRKVAAAGGCAGILWCVEFEDLRELRFVTIETWCSFIAEQTGEPFPKTANDAKWAEYLDLAKRKSMPLSTARARSIEVEPDHRPRAKKPYWKMAELMIRFGASVEPTPERKVKRKQAIKLFDDPTPPQQDIPF